MGNQQVIKIALVGCVKTKLSIPSLARDLYISPLFKKSRAWAEANCDKWFVLSANYGLVSPKTLLEPYGKTLKSFSKKQIEAWAEKVYRQRKAKGLLREEMQFWWLAGSAYKKPLTNFIGEFSQVDPMEGLKLGQRLAWLKSEL